MAGERAICQSSVPKTECAAYSQQSVTIVIAANQCDPCWRAHAFAIRHGPRFHGHAHRSIKLPPQELAVCAKENGYPLLAYTYS